VEDDLHLQGLFSCFTVKDLYLLLSALWPFGLTWYKRREKKTNRVGGGVGRRAGSSPNAAPREEEAGSTAHGGLLPRQSPFYTLFAGRRCVHSRRALISAAIPACVNRPCLYSDRSPAAWEGPRVSDVVIGMGREREPTPSPPTNPGQSRF
jgi:hypothetical protein